MTAVPRKDGAMEPGWQKDFTVRGTVTDKRKFGKEERSSYLSSSFLEDATERECYLISTTGRDRKRLLLICAASSEIARMRR